MKVLIVGNGARESAIAWKLHQSPKITQLLTAPGNAGTQQISRNIPISADDPDGLLRFAQKEHIDFTVVGPEAPLAAGIVDRFDEAGLSIFGPTKAAARIETSKHFAKELMLRHSVPTGRAEVFDDFGLAREYVLQSPLPVVIKADGLAAGKGVVVADTREAALDAIRRQMLTKELGSAGERVLIEEYLEGEELSAFAFVDGERVSPLVAACDYKRAFDGNTGPNTGGMGSYSPPPYSIWNPDVEDKVHTHIMKPIVAALSGNNTPYKGVLYAGLMFTQEGMKVIEFNCRLGDPETQAILPRLKTDLLEVMINTAQGDLTGVSLDWDSRACVGVVMASGGYPGNYKTGYPIDGLDKVDVDTMVFHSNTESVNSEDGGENKVVSHGGRVLTVAARGRTLDDARSKAYTNVARINFTGSFFRKDIALLP